MPEGTDAKAALSMLIGTGIAAEGSQLAKAGSSLIRAKVAKARRDKIDNALSDRILAEARQRARERLGREPSQQEVEDQILQHTSENELTSIIDKAVKDEIFSKKEARDAIRSWLASFSEDQTFFSFGSVGAFATQDDLRRFSPPSPPLKYRTPGRQPGR